MAETLNNHKLMDAAFSGRDSAKDYSLYRTLKNKVLKKYVRKLYSY